MKIKTIFTILLLAAAVLTVSAQGTFTPRDADEAQAWRLYNQYKESRRVEAPLEAQIKAKFNDALMAAYGALAGKAVDPGDVAEIRALREKMETERKRQADLLAAWERKFYWRYGDLRWMNDKIRDAKTGREMDRIEFALTYLPFNYVPDKTARVVSTPTPSTKPSGPADSTSLTLELPGYWGHLSYTITGARLDPPTGGDRGNVAGRQYTGELKGNMLTVSGKAVSDNPSSGPGSMDYYEIVVSVAVGKEKKEYGYIAQKGEKLNKSFSLSVPVTTGATGSFSISLMEQNANYGPHGWVVGGSLKAKGVGTPKVGDAAPAGQPKQLFTTGNDYAVQNGGTPPNFAVKSATTISQIMTYHWNGGKGSNGGTIGLRDQNGKIYGPWVASVRNRVYWEVNRKIELPPGTYTVIDSEPSTWAQNAASGGKGMVTIKGL
ncbi:MAG: hypothetical protein KA956_04535 [Pyrinomonadaceae bacterium]|nr:hypothetical protein [Acidobacteriota bacterium]MBK7933764.1 hypothetical protein [Acidobacteriota bacterium]MBP7375720.1 hypothetical protein [Pyrinomonadaceae bacterium]